MRLDELIDYIRKYFKSLFNDDLESKENWNSDQLPLMESDNICETVKKPEVENLDISQIDKENESIKSKLDEFAKDNENKTPSQEEPNSSHDKKDDIKDVMSEGNGEESNNGDNLKDKDGNQKDTDYKESYEKLLEDFANVIKEMDILNRQVSTDEAKNITDIIPQHIIDYIANGPVELINDITEFNILLHTPMPARRVEKGTPIQEYIRPGIKIGNKVIIRAIVKV